MSWRHLYMTAYPVCFQPELGMIKPKEQVIKPWYSSSGSMIDWQTNI